MEWSRQALITLLFNSAWQVPFICMAAYCGTLLLKKSPARYRHWVWILALMLSLALPLWSLFPAHESANHTLPDASGLALLSFKAHALLRGKQLGAADLAVDCLLSLYATFLTLRLLQFSRAILRTCRFCSLSGAYESGPTLRPVIERCLDAYAISNVSVRYSHEVHAPFTLGIHHPLIILPVGTLESATETEYLSIFSHEMAHIHRKDFVKNLFYELIYLPLSFHPAAMVMHQKIAATRELACDELATERIISTSRYARSLISLAEMAANSQRQKLNYSLGIFDSNILEERIVSLLQPKTTSVMKARVSVGVALAVLMACSVTASGWAFKARAEQPDDHSADAKTIQDWDPGVALIEPGIVPPRAIFNPEPGFPKAERASKKQGTVLLWCVVTADGRVHDAHVGKSLADDFDKAAMGAVKRWKFEPARKDGEPIAVKINIEVDFRYY